jgi:hypothetical protein
VYVRKREENKKMTKDKMTDVEKEKLGAMGIFFNADICTVFECPEEGCTECPIGRVIEAQEDLMLAISEAIHNH